MFQLVVDQGSLLPVVESFPRFLIQQQESVMPMGQALEFRGFLYLAEYQDAVPVGLVANHPSWCNGGVPQLLVVLVYHLTHAFEDFLPGLRVGHDEPILGCASFSSFFPRRRISSPFPDSPGLRRTGAWASIRPIPFPILLSLDLLPLEFVPNLLSRWCHFNDGCHLAQLDVCRRPYLRVSVWPVRCEPHKSFILAWPVDAVACSL